MSIDVRPEDPRDFAAVRSLVARAFTDAEHSAPPVEADGATAPYLKAVMA